MTDALDLPQLQSRIVEIATTSGVHPYSGDPLADNLIWLMDTADDLVARVKAVLALHVMEPITETTWEGNWSSCRECKVAKLDDDVCPTVRAITGDPE